ncbi:hypothetical protein TIFTF001_033291 [Ficus carica]|uniref:Uncharacterized protein n=1 Tax=Ficus carica TaxID=3494 RepID=A0AA88DYN5_FICCA|nr:hypothetical protein TIFTF001_033291 [Ficus carica]
MLAHRSCIGLTECFEKQSRRGSLGPGCPDGCYVSYHSGDGGDEYRSLVLAQVAITVLVRLGGGRLRRSRDKDRYSDRFRVLGVRWCKVVGVAHPATVRLSVSTGRRDRGSLGRPS